MFKQIQAILADRKQAEALKVLAGLEAEQEKLLQEAQKLREQWGRWQQCLGVVLNCIEQAESLDTLKAEVPELREKMRAAGVCV